VATIEVVQPEAGRRNHTVDGLWIRPDAATVPCSALKAGLWHVTPYSVVNEA
jgi:hypothetical protein